METLWKTSAKIVSFLVLGVHFPTTVTYKAVLDSHQIEWYMSQPWLVIYVNHVYSTESTSELHPLVPDIPLITGWSHFWANKFPEFSLRSPGHFQTSLWAIPERKNRWNTFPLAIMPHILHFPWVFQVFSIKVHVFLEIFPIPWVFQVFHVFQACGRPE